PLHFARGRARHQFRVHRCHFLGHQPIVGPPLSLVLVCERHGSEGKHLLALGAHGRDVPLVASGGGYKLEAALAGGGVDHDHGVPAVIAGDPSDERARLGCANPYRLVFVAYSLVPDVDVVVAVRQRDPGLIPDADVLVAGALQEGVTTNGGITHTRSGGRERVDAGGGVLIAGVVGGQGGGAGGRVVWAGG